MSASYPSATKSFSTKTDGQVVSASHVNDVQTEVVAVENGLRLGLDHDLLPLTDNARDLGTASVGWRNGVFKGTVAVTGNTAITGALAVTGATTLTGGVTGATTFTSAITAPGVPLLLRANSGTSTFAANPSTTNVDSIAITGLTAKDRVVVELTLESVGGITLSPQLYHVTDSAQILLLQSSGTPNIASGDVHLGRATISQRQGGATKMAAFNIGSTGAGTIGGGNHYNFITTTTAWTGSWTLALRYASISAGTLQWSWMVWVAKGQ